MKSIDDQIRCAERELRIRKAVYPRWVLIGKIKADVALHEQQCMEAIVETLKERKGDE